MTDLVLYAVWQLQADVNVIVVADAEAVGCGAEEVHLGVRPPLQQDSAHLLEGVALALLLLRAGPQLVHHLLQGPSQLPHVCFGQGSSIRPPLPAQASKRSLHSWDNMSTQAECG